MHTAPLDGRNSNSELSLINAIHITDAQKQILVGHAQKSHPNESCAILYGTMKSLHAKIEDIFFADNADESPTSFTISNEQLIEAYKKAKDCNTSVIGIFHSHPGSEARPSDTDKKFMEINPIVWLIYSGIDDDFRAYVLEKDIREIEVTC